uniref:Uncharacterized protein n=1 Tax=Ciona intestinalis TaxID=7719 RepID=H2XQ26_CIOIN
MKCYHLFLHHKVEVKYINKSMAIHTSRVTLYPINFTFAAPTCVSMAPFTPPWTPGHPTYFKFTH